MSETICLTISDDVKDQVVAVAAAKGISKDDLLRKALDDYLWTIRFHELRKRMVPQAQAQGFYTDEDVFREIS